MKKGVVDSPLIAVFWISKSQNYNSCPNTSRCTNRSVISNRTPSDPRGCWCLHAEHIWHVQGAQKSPTPLPIFTFTKHEQNISRSCNNMLFSFLNGSCETAHSVVDDALQVIESEVIPCQHNHPFNLIIQVKLSIFQACFQQAKEPKVTQTYVWWMGWVRQSWKMIVLEFWGYFDQWWQIAWSICTNKSAVRSDDENSDLPFSNLEKPI
jgi:hypothetical protein